MCIYQPNTAVFKHYLFFHTASFPMYIFIVAYMLLKRFEDTKEVIKIRISKNRQHNGQLKRYKRTNNDLQNIHIKF